MNNPLSLILEFARAEESADPYCFRFTPQQYLVRREGGGFESAAIDWGKDLLADLDAVRRPGRPSAIVQRLGEKLRRFLDEAEWEEMEAQILAASRQKREVVLTIRSAAAELYALPWELVTLRTTGQHLAELPDVLLRYEWPETCSAPPAPAAEDEAGRILFAWSAAAGPVPAAEHLTAIEAACEQGHYPFSREADVVTHASCARIVAALTAAQKEGAPFAVLHLLCHGSADGVNFGLALDGEADADGESKVVVDAGRLRQLLAPFGGTLRLIVLNACDSGNIGELGNQLGSMAQTLHRAGIALVVASRFPLSAVGSIKVTEVLYRELVCGLRSLEQALCCVRQKLAQIPTQLDWASLQLYAHTCDGDDSRPLIIRPYRGLLSFQSEHQRFFFGRKEAVRDVLHNLSELVALGKPRFVVVAGASGTGKSSLVLAGVIPQLLAKKPKTRVARIRPGSDPETPLVAALADLLSSGGAGGGEAATKDPLLLVVDQLEELFTNVPDAKRRESFIQKLWQIASDPASTLCVIVTLRVDFIGRCSEICIDSTARRLDSVAYDGAHRVFVAQLGPDELRLCIEKPAQAVGLILEEGLVLRIIQDVRGEPGALPVLQTTLDLLWQKRRGRLLTQQAYEEMGGVAGALQGRAKALIDSFDEQERRVARRLLLRLVHVADDPAQSTRRSMPLSRLAPSIPAELERFNRVLGRFIEARLVVPSHRELSQPGAGKVRLDYSHNSILLRVPRSQVDLLHSIAPRLGDEGVLIEVAHEALIRKWDLLQQWVEKDRRMLAELDKLEEWVRQWKEMGTLLSGSALGYAIEVGKRYPLDLPHGTRGMLRLSQARANRRARLQRLTWGLSMAVGLILAVLGWFGLIADRQARLFALQARNALRVSEVERLPDKWQRGMILLRELEGREPPPGWLDSAVNALAQADRTIIDLGEPRPSGLPAATAVSRDGSMVLSVAAGNSAAVRSTTIVGLPLLLSGHAAPVTAVALSTDGTLAATAAQDAQIRIFRLSGSTATASVVLAGADKDSKDILALAFSPGGRSLASVSADGSVRLWKVEGGDPAIILPHRSPVYALAYSPDGKQLVTGGSDGLGRVFRTDTGDLLAILSGHTQAIRAVSYSPDGARILTGSDDSTARLWAAAGGPAMATFPHRHPVVATSFNPSGAWLAISTADKIWLGTSAGERLVVLSSPCGDQHQRIAWSPDGKKLFLTLADHTVRILPLELSPQALLRRFWQEQSCPDVRLRQRALLESEVTATANLENCQQLLKCLHEPPRDELEPFDGCYAGFTRRQASLYRRMVFESGPVDASGGPPATGAAGSR